MDVEMFMELPNARNSNLLPVKANGEVRFLSLWSRMNLGSRPTPRSNKSFFLVLVSFAAFDGVDDLGELLAQIHADDCGRGLVGAEPVLVARERHGSAQKVGVLIHRLDNRHQDREELEIVFRRFPGIKQVISLVVGKRPVEVLAAAVDAREGLFVQKAHELVAVRHFFHDVHEHLVMVGGDV